jgi:ribokinase
MPLGAHRPRRRGRQDARGDYHAATLVQRSVINVGRVIVVGSINMDVVARSERIPRPGETVAGATVDLIPGGKGANQAVAARRAGAETVLVGALGRDSFADDLAAFLSGERLSTAAIARVDGPSGTAVIVVDQAGENSIVAIPGANDRVDRRLFEAVEFSRDDVLLLQNEVPEQTNADAVDSARAGGAMTVLSLAPYRSTGDHTLRALSFLVVNESEFANLVDEADHTLSATRVKALLEAGAGVTANIVVTLGPEGLCARVDGAVVSLPGHNVVARDTTGAGDCFCGAFGAALAGGAAPREALRFANAAAALSVQRLGAGPAMPYLADIRTLT